VDPTVAIALLLLLHTPPGVTSANGVLLPEQILTGPDGAMAVGLVFTVTGDMEVQLPTV
jgi:hypothetical protein